jgi:DNA-binding LacI/PurR family transcriptional regulator
MQYLSGVGIIWNVENCEFYSTIMVIFEPQKGKKDLTKELIIYIIQTFAGTIAIMSRIKRHTTITDIAKRLGISPSTVSRALGDHPDIKDETKEQVRKTAKKLRYFPNLIAQSLKNNQTTTIGVIVPEIKHDFFSSAISGIEEVAYQSGYTIIVCQSNESYEREVLNTNMLMHHRVVGVIVSISQNTKSGEHFKDLIRRNIPLVFFDRVCNDVKASKVMIDDYKSAFNAVTYLVNKGYKRIAHFSGPKELGICKNRANGYVDALKQAHMSVQKEFIRYGGLHEQDGYNSMEALLKENTIPDAIFAVNDPVAIGAFQRIKEANLKIPDDIAIMGFSNNKITSLVDPPLTTVDQPSFEMGKKSAEICIKMIEDKIIDRKTLILETKLIIRGST